MWVRFKIITFFVLLIGLCGLALYLQNQPGHLTLLWRGYEMQTSLTVVLFIATLAALGWAVLGYLFNRLKARVRRIQNARLMRKKARGEKAMLDGLLALGHHDSKAASRAAWVARKAQPDAPPSLMLSALAAKLADPQETKEEENYYHALTAKDKDAQTRLAGLHGLFHLSVARGALTDAKHYAQHALSLTKDKKHDWPQAALFRIAAAQGEWQTARKILRRLVKTGAVENATRTLAVLILAEAQDRHAHENKEAIELCTQALKLSPDLIPAYHLLAQLNAAQAKAKKKKWVRQIERQIEHQWQTQPHRELAAAYLALTPNRSASEKLVAIQKLIAPNQADPQSRFALAGAALEAQHWGLARRALADIGEPLRTRHYYVLMARLARGENKDASAAYKWLNAALTAPPDAGWLSPSGQIGAWRAVCPQTIAFDAYIWHQPKSGSYN